MELHFPDFPDDFLVELSACATFNVVPGDNLDEPSKAIKVQCQYPASRGDFWLRLVIESDGGARGHFHIDVMNAEGVDELNALPTVDQGEIIARLAPFAGRLVDTRISAVYSIPLVDLPAKGMIATLLGVGTESCGASLCLIGAAMLIEADLFRKLRWEFDAETELISATIYAETESELADSYLVDVADLMRQGLACFILETGDTKYVKSQAYKNGRLRKTREA